ncbi:hypothetical protein CL622_06365 [archaeon]|nr:hypothetical protein [archaeon]
MEKLKMKKCSECEGEMVEKTKMTPDEISYHYYRCTSCGEEIVDMKQLDQVADKYRVMKKYHATLNKWGLSLGLRIPKQLVEQYKFSEKEEVVIIPEKKGILIVSQSKK